MATGIDLVKQEMESLAQAFVSLLKISGQMKRMDSLMVASSCKKMGRLELIYRCVSNMVRTMQATGETGLMNGRLLQYLDPDDENNTLYRTTGEQTIGKLETVTADARQLVEIAGESLRGTQRIPAIKTSNRGANTRNCVAGRLQS